MNSAAAMPPQSLPVSSVVNSAVQMPEQSYSITPSVNDKFSLPDVTLYTKHLGGNRFVTVNRFKSIILVHLREYDEKNGVAFPTKKGLVLNTTRFATLLRKVNEIEENITKIQNGEDVVFKLHIGGRYNITMSKEFPMVNIRRFFIPKNSTTERASRHGLALPFTQWQTLISVVPDILATVPELQNARPCYDSTDHLNQMGFYSCPECNPYSFLSQNYDS